MIQRPNPISVLAMDGLTPAPNFEDEVKKLHQTITEAHGARESWVEKQEKLLRQRKGVRKDKIFPWPGANNHNWPLTDAIIRRWKPGMVALVLGADPVAYFYPTNAKAVRAAPIAQAYYHWEFNHMAGVKETAMELADNVAQYGTAYTRQGWEYKTRKTCRVINVDKLFPGGVQAVYDAYSQQYDQQIAQLQVAVQQGQADPAQLQQIQAKMGIVELVQSTLVDEYLLSLEEPLEKPQIEAATQQILNGVKQVRIYYKVIVADRPSWKCVSPLDLVCPPRMQSVADADYLVINHRLSADDLMKLAVDGHLEMNPTLVAIEKIEKRKDSAKQEGAWENFGYYQNITDVKDKADGLDTTASLEEGVANIWEIYAKIDINGDKIKEKVVIWYHPDSKTVLAMYPFPYPFEEWPVARFQFEHLSNRPYESRGVAELAAPFQANVNKLHNARLDAVQITLSPMFQMKATAGEVGRNIKFMPGAIIPVQNMGDIAPIPVDTKPVIQLMQEENYTKGLAEQYIGIFDPSVMAQNAVERRTATEVEAVMQQTQAVFGQDAALFQEGMRVVHRQLWQLCMEFGRDELYFRVTGEQIPTMVKKHEIDDEYDIVPAGTPANTSKQLAMARTREAMQLFLQDQTGLIDKYELIKTYFDVLDPNLAKLVLRSKDQAAAIQMVMQAVQEIGKQQGIPPAQLPTAP